MNLNKKAIKADYCARLRENQRLREEVEKLELEKALLLRQRGVQHAARLVELNAPTARPARFRQGLLVGVMTATALMTLVAYAATHAL